MDHRGAGAWAAPARAQAEADVAPGALPDWINKPCLQPPPRPAAAGRTLAAGSGCQGPPSRPICGPMRGPSSPSADEFAHIVDACLRSIFSDAVHSGGSASSGLPAQGAQAAQATMTINADGVDQTEFTIPKAAAIPLRRVFRKPKKRRSRRAARRSTTPTCASLVACAASSKALIRSASRVIRSTSGGDGDLDFA